MIQMLKEFYFNPLNHKLVNKKTMWKPEDGVTPKGVNFLCRYYNISHYAYDMTNRCFLKFVAPHRNHHALIYFFVGNHMHWVSDKKAAHSLVMRARDVEINMNSNMFEVEDHKENIHKTRENNIFENVPVEDLVFDQYQDCIIIYSATGDEKMKHNLNDELDKIIEIYDVVPKVKNQKYNITSIDISPSKFGNSDPFLNQNILLVLDPNDTRLIDYKDMQQLCKRHKIEFENQSFGNFIKQVREKHYNNKSIRKKYSQQERAQIHEKCGGQCMECHKNLQTKQMHIDHIIPLANGGPEHKENLQVLCKKCHVDKSSQEKEQGYVRVSETESSFNLKTHEIFNSNLCGSYAFVERWAELDGRTQKVWHLDINKCRANCLYYSKYDFPLFTVMDEPVEFKGNAS